MTCETEAKALEDALKPAKIKKIECDAIEEKAWNELSSLKAKCAGAGGGGIIAGALAGAAVGSGFLGIGAIFGAAIGAGLGGLGGGLKCVSDASTYDNLVVDHNACLELYKLELNSAQDEFANLSKCVVRGIYSFLL